MEVSLRRMWHTNFVVGTHRRSLGTPGGEGLHTYPLSHRAKTGTSVPKATLNPSTAQLKQATKQRDTSVGTFQLRW